MYMTAILRKPLNTVYEKLLKLAIKKEISGEKF